MNTSFGETLRAAREAKGLTTSQIASKTRMLVQIVEEMENEDFHRIAAPIYGRGFVKLYAECVDLDPLPLVKEFMEIYEGRRAPIVRTREVPVAAQPATPEPPPAPEPSPEPPPVVRGLELFEAAAPRQPQPPQEPVQPATAPQPPAANVADIFSDSPYLASGSSYDSEGPSAAERFKNSLSSVSYGVIQKVRDIPRSVWRITLLVLATIVLLALLVWGCIKLYSATSITPTQQPQALNLDAPNDPKPAPTATPKAAPNAVPKATPKAAPQPAPKAAPKPMPAKPAKRPPLRSTGQKVPPLYAD